MTGVFIVVLIALQTELGPELLDDVANATWGTTEFMFGVHGSACSSNDVDATE